MTTPDSDTQQLEFPDSQSAKPWWASKTIIGIAAMLLSQVLKLWKLEVFPAEITDLLLMALDFGGATLAVYGRVKARKDLTMTTPGGVFNRSAETRKGIKVSDANRRKGYVRLPVLLAAVCWVGIAFLGVAVMEIGRGDWKVQKYPDITETVDLTSAAGGLRSAEWVQASLVEDRRPFLIRLWESLRWSIRAEAWEGRDTLYPRPRLRAEVKGGAEF